MTSNTPLGIGGFSFADLHQPARLRELHQRFVEQVNATEPELWSEWARYCEVPESLTPVRRGNIVVAMAPHVSRFIAALFSVGADAEALAEATRAYDVLFRFKIDFVRRRALPLLKGGAHVEAGADDHALAEEIMFGTRQVAGALSFVASHDAETRLAVYGCSLLDREATDKAAWCLRHVVALSSRATSSRLSTTGRLRRCARRTSLRARSGRSSVWLKKKRSADTMLFIVGTGTPSFCCSIWNRRRSSAVAVSGDRPRNVARRPISRR